jgi:AmmeMemoRadiSam system protein B/AmmeMemoRadiSam system protein A
MDAMDGDRPRRYHPAVNLGEVHMRIIEAAVWISVLVGACAGCNDNKPTATAPEPQAKAGAPDPQSKTAPKPQAEAGTTQAKAGTPTRIENAFPAQVAGQFYPADPEELRSMVRGFIDAAKAGAVKPDRDVVGVLAPHAGYRYSGPIAGASYRALEGRGYRTVVVMSLNHRRPADRIATLDRPAYDTPLGSLPIDVAAVKALTSAHPELFAVDEAMFEGEHSLEVQLPFVQVALPAASIVPLVVAVDDDALLDRAGKALFEVFGGRRDAAFVVSSDLSHYHPYDQANAFDEETLGALERFDLAAWRKAASRQSEGMCGFRPMEVFTAVFAGFDAKKRSIVRLDHRNSGDTTGDKSSVVGYGALAFTVENGMRKEESKAASFGPYDAAARRELMSIAKRAVEAAAKGESFTPPEPAAAALKEMGAAFVTLKEAGDLRGCIGHVIARMPLYKCVAEVGRAAAVEDTRFDPVRPDELPKLTYEISVLTAPEPTTIDEIVVGRDGLIMSRGGYSGLLLPQVPGEWGWGKEEFLMHTCRKAGLPMDCWKDPATRIQSFRAIVWGEGDF